MKIATILFLATYFTGIGNGIRELPRFLLGLVIILVPDGPHPAAAGHGRGAGVHPHLPPHGASSPAPRCGTSLFILLAGVLAFVLAAIPTLHARSGPGGASFFGLLADSDILKYLLLAAAVVAGLALLGWRSFRQRYFFWISWSGALLLVAGLLSACPARRS